MEGPSRMNGGAHDQQVDAEQPQNRSENRRESLEERRRKAAEGMEGGEVIDGIPADFGPYSRRHVRPEDILWWLCLFFTFAYFDLPAVLICHNQIDRQFLKMAFVCAICLPFLLFTYPLAKMPNRTHAPALFRVFQLLSIFCFFGNAFFFCLATWKVFGVWAVFIAGVTSIVVICVRPDAEMKLSNTQAKPNLTRRRFEQRRMDEANRGFDCFG
uniref:Transmembrane protein n=1 Tax=Globodera rostochiensis TaxID=31243 RepID=A0A914HYA4_GLORO